MCSDSNFWGDFFQGFASVFGNCTRCKCKDTDAGDKIDGYIKASIGYFNNAYQKMVG